MDYKQVLEELGYRLKDHGSYWRTSAVYRSGDNSTALQIYKDTGVWKDYVEDSIFLPFRSDDLVFILLGLIASCASCEFLDFLLC